MKDVQLIKQSQSGNKEAFQKLIKNYYDMVFKYLLKMSGDETLSEDIAQETFLKVVKNIEKFDIHGKASFSTYVITIAKNSYIDFMRKKRHDTVRIEEVPLSVRDEYFKSMDFDEMIEKIDRLPKNQAEAIKLKYIEDLTLAEIAAIQDTEAKTIKSRIHSGMKKLRNSLKGGL